ncbi:DUF397 domain-containing protein [Streptomyces sp. MAI_2237]
MHPPYILSRACSAHANIRATLRCRFADVATPRRADRHNDPRRSSEKGINVLHSNGVWVKSSHSESGACVEVSLRERLSVRDSKDHRMPQLGFGATAWTSFTASLRAEDSITEI